jgi:hypothetical protein
MFGNLPIGLALAALPFLAKFPNITHTIIKSLIALPIA